MERLELKMSFYSISESERKKIYYKYNRDWILEYGKIWRKNHPEYNKIWYQKHPEYNKKYYQNNRERLCNETPYNLIIGRLRSLV